MSLFGRSEPTVPLSLVVALRRQDSADQQTRYDALLEKYHALKASGAVLPPVPVATVPVVVEQPDELQSLIAERCGSDYRKRAMMLQQLANDRRNGLDDDTIRGFIQTGIVSDGVPV